MSRPAHPLTMKIEMTGEGTGPTTEREIPVFGILEAAKHEPFGSPVDNENTMTGEGTGPTFRKGYEFSRQRTMSRAAHP